MRKMLLKIHAKDESLGRLGLRWVRFGLLEKFLFWLHFAVL